MAEKKYLDDAGLDEVAQHVNKRLKVVDVMPASANTGAVRLYTGATTADYIKGGTYQYNGEAWEQIDTPPTEVHLGYYYNNKFYKESSHTTEIAAEDGALYIDASTDTAYRYDSSTTKYTKVSGFNWARGYYFDNAFWVNKTGAVYSNQIPKDTKTIYIDNSTSTLYIYTGSSFVSIGGFRYTAGDGIAIVASNTIKVIDRLIEVDELPALTPDITGNCYLLTGTQTGYHTGAIYQAAPDGNTVTVLDSEEATYSTFNNCAALSSSGSSPTMVWTVKNGYTVKFGSSSNTSEVTGFRQNNYTNIIVAVYKDGSMGTYSLRIGGVGQNLYMTYDTFGFKEINEATTDISGKADKVSGATNGDFAGLDANGNLMDSGKKASDFLGYKITTETDANNVTETGIYSVNVNTMSNLPTAETSMGYLLEVRRYGEAVGSIIEQIAYRGNPTNESPVYMRRWFANAWTSWVAVATKNDIPTITGKADKVASAVNGNFAGLDANGNLTDSGIFPSSVASESAMVLTSSDDLNNVTTPGFYYTVNTDNPSNIPSGTNINNNIIEVIKQGSVSRCVQLFYSINAQKMWFRIGNSVTNPTSWSSWELIAFGSLATKADLISSPTANNLVAMDANGNIKDSGLSVLTTAFTDANNCLPTEGKIDTWYSCNDQAGTTASHVPTNLRNPNNSYPRRIYYLDAINVSGGIVQVCHVAYMEDKQYNPWTTDVFYRFGANNGSSYTYSSWSRITNYDDIATASTNGLMSSTDKTKLDNLANNYHITLLHNYSAPPTNQYTLLWSISQVATMFAAPISLKGTLGTVGSTDKILFDVTIDFRLKNPVYQGEITSNTIAAGLADILATWDDSTNTARIYAVLKAGYSYVDIYSNVKLTSSTAVANPEGTGTATMISSLKPAQLITLTNPITVDGTQETTVEGALGGLNTALQSIATTNRTDNSYINSIHYISFQIPKNVWVEYLIQLRGSETILLSGRWSSEDHAVDNQNHFKAVHLVKGYNKVSQVAYVYDSTNDTYTVHFKVAVWITAFRVIALTQGVTVPALTSTTTEPNVTWYNIDTKQDETLSTALSINGESRTTIEAAISALNSAALGTGNFAKTAKQIKNSSSTVKYYKIISYSSQYPFVVKVIGQRTNATASIQELSGSYYLSNRTYTITKHAIPRYAASAGTTTTEIESGAYLIVDANHDVWVCVTSYSRAQIELTSAGTAILGTEGTPVTPYILNGFTATDSRYANTVTSGDNKAVTSGAVYSAIDTAITQVLNTSF